MSWWHEIVGVEWTCPFCGERQDGVIELRYGGGSEKYPLRVGDKLTWKDAPPNSLAERRPNGTGVVPCDVTCRNSSEGRTTMGAPLQERKAMGCPAWMSILVEFQDDVITRAYFPENLELVNTEPGWVSPRHIIEGIMWTCPFCRESQDSWIELKYGGLFEKNPLHMGEKLTWAGARPKDLACRCPDGSGIVECHVKCRNSWYWKVGDKFNEPSLARKKSLGCPKWMSILVEFTNDKIVGVHFPHFPERVKAEPGWDT